MSRIEELLQAIINGDTANIKPRSRAEEYLVKCACKECDNLPTPKSRLDALYYQLAHTISEGGGGGDIDFTLATAKAADVVQGKTFYAGNKTLKTGSLTVPDLSSTTATATDVASGKKFYNADGELVDGAMTATIQKFIELNGNSCKYLFGQLNTIIDVTPLLNGVDTSGITATDYMFYNCTALKTVPLFDTSNVEIMDQMFSGCKVLETVPLFDTSKVKKMINMFYNCTALKTVPLFDTSNADAFAYMFYNCTALETVPLFDISNATNVNGMFQKCSKIKKVKLIGVSSNIKQSNSWFTNCTSLELIDFRGASGVPTLSNVSAFTSVPSTCKVVIPDSLYDTWTNATNWSAISITWVKASEYVEA